MRAGVVNAVLLLATLGIAAWTALQVLAPTAGPGLAQVRTPQVEVALPEAAQMNPAPALADDLTERPLLWSERRPLPPKAVETAATPEPASKDFVLTGIVRSPRGDIALITVDGDVKRVGRGQRVGGWTVDDIRAGEVELSRGGQKRIIPLLLDDQAAPVKPRRNPAPTSLPGAASGSGIATEPLFNGKAVVERLRDRKPAKERQNRQRNNGS
ncbi:MAG: hypothetical protein RBT51_11550 [Ectothiorhodospiraceae bacterium]|jgi:hypothetical protein|nr:hypothetical protein [Ectothiorhodospiraceae bacterium]